MLFPFSAKTYCVAEKHATDVKYRAPEVTAGDPKGQSSWEAA